GDQALEFLDVREAALVSVAEALARRALPWQAQLCPRALQDFEVARVRVFHASERKRQGECKARQDELLREKLLGEERSWELFGRAQGRLFEDTLDQIIGCVKRWESDHAAYAAAQAKKQRERLRKVEGLSRQSINAFEQSEADRGLLFRRSSQVDLLWDPVASTSIKEAREEDSRATNALENWSKGYACATAKLDASIWLEAVGAPAFASEEHARWRRGVTEIAREDRSRAEADRTCERRRSSESYSIALQTLWESDRTEKEISEESWNLQGWLSVGSHKLVQQTLRALVRRCHHPYAVRNVLWEARRAAEFAAAARAAAASQLCDDCRGLCKLRRDRRATVRDHKRDLLLVEERRASTEDAERIRIAQDTVERLLGTSAAAKRDEMHAGLQEERTRALAAREAEVDRCGLFREEMEGLQHELDRETERLATSLRERREEEERQIVSEVSLAESSLKEEQARADDRKALLREMILTEREREDRLLSSWLRQQEDEGRKEVRRQLQEARERAVGDRDRWIHGINLSMFETSSTDAAFFRSPRAWKCSSAAPLSGRTVLSSPKTAGKAPLGAMLPSDYFRQTSYTAEGETEVNASDSNHEESRDWAPASSSSRVGIEAHHDGASFSEQEPGMLLTEDDGGGGDGSGGAKAGAAGVAAGTAPERITERKNNKSESSSSNNTNFNARLTTAAQAEHLAAGRRNARLESLACLARQGLEAHWEAFFRDEIERTRMAATAADMTAARWEHHQCQADEMFWAPWRAKDWEPTGLIDGSGVGAVIGAAGQPHGVVAGDGDGATCS
ncbi:unnamed protein product, partial [Hapterophycus canaliculatus]